MSDLQALDLSTFSEPDLFTFYQGILAELKTRGVIRTGNAPAGDYAEYRALPEACERQCLVRPPEHHGSPRRDGPDRSSPGSTTTRGKEMSNKSIGCGEEGSPGSRKTVGR
jgi:hypothetical protein